MQKNKLKNIRGFVGTDAAIAIICVVIFISIVMVGTINIYNTKVSSYKSAMATNCIVKVFEQAEIMNYNDPKLEHGTYEILSGVKKEVLGVQIPISYKTKLVVTDYNKTPGNTDKKNIIKILELSISYPENKLEKNITFKTLKLDK